MEDTRVYVFKMKGHASLQLQYRDPITGKLKTESAGTSKEGEAKTASGKWKDDLHKSRCSAPSKLTWAEFRTRYEDEALSGLSGNSAELCCTSFNALERIIDPKRLRDVTAAQASKWQAVLRAEKLSEATIAAYGRHLSAALAWGVNVGLLSIAPKIQRPKRAKGSKSMKGRPITREEFEQMLAKVPAIVGDKAAASWRCFLEGLYLSGLRLTVGLELWWDRDYRPCVDLLGRRPMLRIRAELEKGKQEGCCRCRQSLRSSCSRHRRQSEPGWCSTYTRGAATVAGLGLSMPLRLSLTLAKRPA